MEQNEIVINEVNDELIQKGPSKLKKNKFGKGKILTTIDKVLVGAAAVFEGLRELPGFEYLKTMTTSNIVTKFNTWIASITANTPDLTGLTATQAYELGMQAQAAGTVASANSIGLVFAAVLEFIVQHPTVTVLGVTAFIGILSIPFKMLVRKIREKKEQKNAVKQL